MFYYSGCPSKGVPLRQKHSLFFVSSVVSSDVSFHKGMFEGKVAKRRIVNWSQTNGVGIQIPLSGRSCRCCGRRGEAHFTCKRGVFACAPVATISFARPKAVCTDETAGHLCQLSLGLLMHPSAPCGRPPAVSLLDDPARSRWGLQPRLWNPVVTLYAFITVAVSDAYSVTIVTMHIGILKLSLSLWLKAIMW